MQKGIPSQPGDRVTLTVEASTDPGSTARGRDAVVISGRLWTFPLAIRVENERYGTIVGQPDLHVGTKDTGRDLRAQQAQ